MEISKIDTYCSDNLNSCVDQGAYLVVKSPLSAMHKLQDPLHTRLFFYFRLFLFGFMFYAAHFLLNLNIESQASFTYGLLIMKANATRYFWP